MRGIVMGDVSAEPSMEDILSSIKRIIAEEGESAVAASARSRRPVSRPAPAMSQADADEVLELSTPAPADPAPPAAPVAAPAAEANAILSPRTAEASRGALDTLSRLIVKTEEQAADNTLEGLVREMLRPMLKEWLDARLPGLVEAMVAREIARITGQR